MAEWTPEWSKTVLEELEMRERVDAAGQLWAASASSRAGGVEKIEHGGPFQPIPRQTFRGQKRIYQKLKLWTSSTTSLARTKASPCFPVPLDSQTEV